jgi:hypothetical protein
MSSTPYRLLQSVFWGRGSSGRGGAFRTAVAALAGAAGIFSISLSVQLAVDLNAAFNRGTRGLPDREYVVVSKKIDLGMALAQGRSAFTDSEIALLATLPGVVSVDPVASNMFAASLSLRFGGVELGTEIFYESVSDDFLGELPEGWGWKEGERMLPILISRDFLALYNLGFAASRGLPPVSDAVLGMVSARSTVTGPGGTFDCEARIVGLTDRISSILVPQSFMSWANRAIALQARPAARRLVVETQPAKAAALDAFLRDRGWERNRQGGAAAGILALGRTALTVALSAGALLACLAVALLALSLSLAVERSRESIRVVRLIGYSRARLGVALGAGAGASVVAAAAAAAAGAGLVDGVARAFISRATGADGPVGIPAAALLTAGALAIVFACILPLAGWRLIARLDRDAVS